MRFSGEPSAFSMLRMLRTSRWRPDGSSEAAWSGPIIVRSIVKCRSTTVAPRATAASVGASPRSWPE
jgi:hypothetical protein